LKKTRSANFSMLELLEVTNADTVKSHAWRDPHHMHGMDTGCEGGL
jgi:hypothetical protein